MGRAAPNGAHMQLLVPLLLCIFKFTSVTPILASAVSHDEIPARCLASLLQELEAAEASSNVSAVGVSDAVQDFIACGSLLVGSLRVSPCAWPVCSICVTFAGTACLC